MTLRLAFMGTPHFSVPALEALIESDHIVQAVYSQPPRPAGRGKKLRPSPVQEAAEAHDIPVFTPVSLRDEAEQAHFRALELDVAVVVAYGLILPKPVLDAPRLGCVNIHASLLPRWRGAAPIQRAVLAGDKETGISIMQMDEGLDTGPVILEEPVEILPLENSGELHDRLSLLGARLIVEALDGLAAGSLHARPQEGEATYAAKLEKSEGRLDFNRTSAELNRQICAFTPWPGCYFELGPKLGGERVKVLASHPFEKAEPVAQLVGPDHAPGCVLDGACQIQCGGGSSIRLDRVQRAGRSPVDGATFLRGLDLEPGANLFA